MMKQNFLGMTVHVHHKGGNSQAEMNRANQQQAQQNALMQQQLAMQQGQLNMVNPTLNSIIQNGGMTPQQQAAMTSQATALTGANEQQAIGNINQALVARGITGGQNAGGGAIANTFGGLESQLAGQQAGLLNQIQTQKGQQLMQALGTGLGESQFLGNQALGFGQQAGSALGAGVQAAGNADQNQTGFWGSLTGELLGLGGTAMKGLGSYGNW